MMTSMRAALYKTRAHVRVLYLEIERRQLEAERGALVATRTGGDALSEFRTHFLSGQTDDEASDAADYDRAAAAESELTVGGQLDVIRGSFRVTLTDGAGADRVQVIPLWRSRFYVLHSADKTGYRACG
jgi:hypothetical protein